jgi:CheY-like chemotaxis protein
MIETLHQSDEPLRGRKVLVVDDDIRNIFALNSLLERHQMDVLSANNGQDAINLIEATEDLSLVLMDVMMPEMDGLEATRRLRQDPRFAKLPVIAVTAKAMKDDQEQCRRAGANDYLAKPIDLDRLFSLMRVWMPAIERV